MPSGPRIRGLGTAGSINGDQNHGFSNPCLSRQFLGERYLLLEDYLAQVKGLLHDARSSFGELSAAHGGQRRGGGLVRCEQASAICGVGWMVGWLFFVVILIL